MEMSPQRVRSAEFKTIRKGADPDEVKLFLSDVADELERAQNQATAMEARARAAVARLQEAAQPAASVPAVDASVDESETISRTLLLAQRTADTAVAEARSEASRIVGAANDEAATTLDSTREMASQLLAEARVEARRVGETERAAIASDVEALKARRDFLEADVEHLELFITEQRSRIRDAATSLIDITERIPGGLGEARAPLLSASDDHPAPSAEAADVLPDEPKWDLVADADVSGSAGEWPDEVAPEVDDLLIVTEIADSEPTAPEPAPVDDPWADPSNDPTQAMPVVSDDRSERRDPGDDDFRFSFDDDRS
jgi:cell division initiation protein